MKKNACAQLTESERSALGKGLGILEQARTLLSEIRALGSLQGCERWREAREQWAEGIQQSFDSFLACPSIPLAYALAAWIDQPAALMKEISQFAQMFDIESVLMLYQSVKPFVEREGETTCFSRYPP